MEIFALMIENEEEQNISLFWRMKDVAEALPEMIREMLPDDVNTAEKAIERIQGRDVDKALSYLNRRTDWDFEVFDVPIEGAVDAALLRKIENQAAFDGPQLSVVQGAAVKAKVGKPKKVNGKKKPACVTYINDVQVQ